jgi:hypothetical protein
VLILTSPKCVSGWRTRRSAAAARHPYPVEWGDDPLEPELTSIHLGWLTKTLRDLWLRGVEFMVLRSQDGTWMKATRTDDV